MWAQIQKLYFRFTESLTGKFRVVWLLLFAGIWHGIHFLHCPFPTRDSLKYLHILHDWNTTGSLSQVLEKFPKFALLLFPFLPLKWANAWGIPLYGASVVMIIAMSMVSVYLFYRIVYLLTGDVKKAMWCGALLAAQPTILFYAGNLLRDTPYLMFCLLFALCFIYAVRNRKWYCFLSTGATLAMCLMCRFEAWELLALFPLYAIFFMVKRKFCAREIWLFVVLAAIGFFGTILLMLLAIDDPALLYAKVRCVLFSYFPKWMGQ